MRALSLLFVFEDESIASLLRWNRFADYFKTIPITTLVLTVSGFAYLIVIRLLNIVGLLAMLRRRAWVPLVAMLGAMVYLTLIMLFSGTSRFRLPLDPMLFIIAAYGIAELREKWFRRS